MGTTAMKSLLGDVLPLAFGAAVSPTLLGMQLLVLTGRRSPLARAWAVVVGCAFVLGVFGVLAGTVLQGGGHHRASVTSGVIKLAAAGLLAFLGVRQILRRPTAGEKHKDATGSRFANAATPSYVWIGALAMLVNFSTLILFIPAVHDVTRSRVPFPDQVVAFAALALITLLPALVPPLIVGAMGKRADPLLDRLNRAVTRHARQIGAAICFAFAVYLGVKGIQIVF